MTQPVQLIRTKAFGRVHCCYAQGLTDEMPDSLELINCKQLQPHCWNLFRGLLMLLLQSCLARSIRLSIKSGK